MFFLGAIVGWILGFCLGISDSYDNCGQSSVIHPETVPTQPIVVASIPQPDIHAIKIEPAVTDKPVNNIQADGKPDDKHDDRHYDRDSESDPELPDIYSDTRKSTEMSFRSF